MRFLYVLVSAIVLTVSLNGCARTDESDLSGSANSGTSELAESAIQVIEDYSSASFPDNFTSVAIEADQHNVIVYRVPGSNLDGAISSRFPETPMRFVDARFTRQQLLAIKERVSADATYWASRGVQINVVGPAPDGNSVEVGITNPAAAQDDLYARYGHNNIRVIAQGPMSMGPYNGPLTVPEQPRAK